MCVCAGLRGEGVRALVAATATMSESLIEPAKNHQGSLRIRPEDGELGKGGEGGKPSLVVCK